MSSVQLQGLKKEYPGIVAVDDVDLEIQTGEFLTLLGPSGSGKSTILRLIAGLEDPTAGRTILDGNDVTDLPAYKRDVNTVFQDLALFPHMTVAENIAYGLEIRGEESSKIKSRVTDLLDLVDLPSVEDRSIESLSGGQQQRVALARALAIQPEVLLLDEPLSALDEKLRRSMQVELKDIQEQLDTTFVYVTHDQEEAMSMSDRIVVINNGEIVQIGAPNEIYDHPQTEFVASFFHDANIFSGTGGEPDGDVSTIELGDLVAYSEDHIEPGKETKFFVHPENISLVTDGEAVPSNESDTALNLLSGQVTNSVYRGRVIEYIVSIGKYEFKVTTKENSFSEGDTVTLAWDASKTIPFES